MVINFMVTEFLLVTQWIFLQGGELFEGHGSSRCTDLSSFSMDLFGAFLTPSSWQKSFSQFVVIVIIVIPKLLQVYSCAKCHSYWVLVWCKDVWVMQHCSELQTLRGRSLRKCQRVLQLMFPSCSEFSQGFGCQCQPKTLRYFKQYGAEASGSLIHPHMQNLGRDSEYNRETIWRSLSWFKEFNDQKQETYKIFVRSKLYISPLINIHSHLAALGISVVRICSLPIVSRSLEKRLQDCGKMRSKVWQISLSYLGSILVGSRSQKWFLSESNSKITKLEKHFLILRLLCWRRTLPGTDASGYIFIKKREAGWFLFPGTWWWQDHKDFFDLHGCTGVQRWTVSKCQKHSWTTFLRYNPVLRMTFGSAG